MDKTLFQTLTLENFQPHKKLVINLDPHATTIIGPGDRGKSAIFRALRWLVFNRPSGDAFIHHGEKYVRVTLTSDKGEVVREKGKGRNLYILNGKELEAIGSDVPAAVQSFLRLAPINFQRQHDAPFWFTLTAGEISRQLNEIVNLEVMDTTLANLASMQREAATSVAMIEERLAQAKKDREHHKPALRIDEELQVVESLEQHRREVAEKLPRLQGLLRDGRDYVERQDKAAQARRTGHSALEKGQIWQATSVSRERLQNLLVAARTARETLNRGVPDLRPLEKLYVVWSTLTIKKQALEEIVEQLTRLETDSCQARRDRDAATETLKKTMGKICPLCNQPIR